MLEAILAAKNEWYIFQKIYLTVASESGSALFAQTCLSKYLNFAMLNKLRCQAKLASNFQQIMLLDPA